MKKFKRNHFLVGCCIHVYKIRLILPNRFLRLSQLKSLLNNFFKSQLLKSLRLPSYIRSIRYIASYTQPLSTSARSDRTRPFLLCVMTTYKNDCERPIYYILIQQYITSFSMLKIGFFIYVSMNLGPCILAIN